MLRAALLVRPRLVDRGRGRGGIIITFFLQTRRAAAMGMGWSRPRNWRRSTRGRRRMEDGRGTGRLRCSERVSFWELGRGGRHGTLFASSD